MGELKLIAVFLIVIFLVVMILTAIFMIKQGKDKKKILFTSFSIIFWSFLIILLILGWEYIKEISQGTWAEGIVIFIETILRIILKSML